MASGVDRGDRSRLDAAPDSEAPGSSPARCTTRGGVGAVEIPSPHAVAGPSERRDATSLGLSCTTRPYTTILPSRGQGKATEKAYISEMWSCSGTGLRLLAIVRRLRQAGHEVASVARVEHDPLCYAARADYAGRVFSSIRSS